MFWLGWFADDIVVYLFRTLLRFAKEYRSRAWPTAAGAVVQSSSTGSFYPRVELLYSFTVEGESYVGTCNRGFFLRSSANDYSHRFAKGTGLVIRYKPGAPLDSFVCAADQWP
jgi:hypothetical protein